MTMSMEEIGARLGEEIYYEHMRHVKGELGSWYGMTPQEQAQWHKVGRQALVKAMSLLSLAATEAQRRQLDCRG